MTLRLILTRHAKSAWDTPGQNDHDRPLNARGQQAAPLIGDWLANRGYVPGEVLCSSAARTQETWAHISGSFPKAIPLQIKPALYLADSTQILQVLQSGTAPTLMLLGHNNGIADFARALLHTPPSHPRFADYPTGATLVADFDAPDWAKVGFGNGRAVDFTIPRELAPQT